MKYNSCSFLMLCAFGFSPAARALSLDHQCKVEKTVQVMNKKSGVSQVTRGASNYFPVTKLEHEEPFEVAIVDKDSNEIGKAKVDTGTLLETNEGDLIQAHAYLEIDGKEEYLGMVASTKSPMARSHRYFTKETESELLLTNVDLQCEIKP